MVKDDFSVREENKCHPGLGFVPTRCCVQDSAGELDYCPGSKRRGDVGVPRLLPSRHQPGFPRQTRSGAALLRASPVRDRQVGTGEDLS